MREENEIETIMNNDRVTVSFAAIINLKVKINLLKIPNYDFRITWINLG